MNVDKFLQKIIYCDAVEYISQTDIKSSIFK